MGWVGLGRLVEVGWTGWVGWWASESVCGLGVTHSLTLSRVHDAHPPQDTFGPVVRKLVEGETKVSKLQETAKFQFADDASEGGSADEGGLERPSLPNLASTMLRLDSVTRELSVGPETHTVFYIEYEVYRNMKYKIIPVKTATIVKFV